MAKAAARVENNGENKVGGVTGKGFVKGVSGNPGGRPKGLAKAVRDRLQQAAPDGGSGADVLVAIWTTIAADQKEDTGHRLKATQLLAERGWGKPPMYAPMEDDDPLEMSEREADEIAAGFDRSMDELAKRRAAR